MSKPSKGGNAAKVEVTFSVLVEEVIRADDHSLHEVNQHCIKKIDGWALVREAVANEIRRRLELPCLEQRQKGGEA